ncbi:MAG TPA: hypothetical protein DHV36_15095 [Desulfobacteraceae bacterium]|nr:hypothetical protein [Desulfobacteraceae bacterium]
MNSSKPSAVLAGFYVVALKATFLAMLVVMLLNISTPFEFARERISELNSGNWPYVIAFRFGLLVLATAVATCPLLLGMRQMLAPVRLFLEGKRERDGIQALARQRIINLPFIIVPLNIGLWIFIPMAMFFTLFRMGAMDAATAITFSLRSTLVGLVSSALIFFSLEAHARKELIPQLFPEGRLYEVENTRRLSIKRRVRAFFRMGILLPLTHIVLTLFVLYLQVEINPMSTREYAGSVLIFSLVAFVLFFIGSGIMTRLISRSISHPLTIMLKAMKSVRDGDYNTRVQVVSNDEIGILGDAFNRMIQGLADRRRVRDAFGRYVDPRIRDEILSGNIPLDGAYKHVTVMFADLRDFTPLTATLDPKQVVSLLNGYFKEMSAAIKAHNGLILQFLGDEIYAVFGAPVADPDHPLHAVRAALDMDAALARLNRGLEQCGRTRLAHGIGIHTGQVLAANIGSPERLSYLLVGETVNLASRLQAKTRDMNVDILLSEDTAACIPDDLSGITPVPFDEPVSIKGFTEPVHIFTLGST